MKKFLFLLIVSSLSFSACSISRRVAAETERSPWEGYDALDIMKVMGDPDAIDVDGRNGSILRYKSTPDDTDPEYDILDPNASSRVQQYANFYLNEEGYCYRVDTNRDLPSPPGGAYYSDEIAPWLDLLVYLPLLLISILL